MIPEWEILAAKGRKQNKRNLTGKKRGKAGKSGKLWEVYRKDGWRRAESRSFGRWKKVEEHGRTWKGRHELWSDEWLVTVREQAHGAFGPVASRKLRKDLGKHWRFYRFEGRKEPYQAVRWLSK